MIFMRKLHYAAALSVAVSALVAPAPSLAADELEALAHAADSNLDDAKAVDAYAAAALKQKRYDEAIRRLKVAVARVPDYTEGYYKLAFAYRQKREWADAADYYRRYVSVNPARTDTYFGLGAALQGLGDKKGAIAAYEKYVALEKAPAKQRFVDQARAELSRLDPTRGDALVDPSGSHAATAPSSSPSDRGRAETLRAQADALRGQNRFAEAAAAYQRAIAADRDNLELYNDLGNSYFALKQYGDAAKAFADATARDGNYALGWYNLAHALRKAERPREAADAYRQYIRLKPDDPDPYYGLGQTLKALGDAPGAISAFRKYVSMERRPDEQKWVEKARVELQALEAMQPRSSSTSSSAAAARLDERSLIEDAAARERLDRELRRDAVLPPTDDDLRLMDPFQHAYVHDLKDPFRDGDEIIDPFSKERGVAAAVPVALTPSAEKLRQYGVALATYRRALARHAEDVTTHFERGVASALSANNASTLRSWNNISFDDPELAAARVSVERIRKQLFGK
jgi:tetratricopeptide (TPR) repeat protein